MLVRLNCPCHQGELLEVNSNQQHSMGKLGYIMRDLFGILVEFNELY